MAFDGKNPEPGRVRWRFGATVVIGLGGRDGWNPEPGRTGESVVTSLCLDSGSRADPPSLEAWSIL